MSTLARKAAVLIAGGGAYVSAVFLSYRYLRPDRTESEVSDSGCTCLDSPNRTQKFEHIAEVYDRRIQWEEFFMGINLLRRSLLRHAKGDVLEVGAGTARNLPYYPVSVQRLVLSDKSPNMLDQAQRKVDANKKVITLQADASKLPLPTRSFDTVVDTFGLCSYDNPVDVLKEMARVCKPNGRILLLEHGRSKSSDWISHHLDRTAEQHASNWGCVWNRDLDLILEKSGLDIEIMHRWHFGTTYYVVCRPATCR